MRPIHALLGIWSLALCFIAPAVACDLCPQSGAPLSYEIKNAKMVVFGHVTNAKFGLDRNTGSTELAIDAMIKADPQFKDLKTITLPGYTPPDPNVKGFLVMLDAPKGRLDPYRGIACSSDRIVRYLQDSPPFLDDKAPVDRRGERLLYYFKHLNDSESDIAFDAYKEWAMAGNREVGSVASKVSAKDLRTWLVDPKTPTSRLSLYAFLLGACGNDTDAELLKRFVLTRDDRVTPALDGLLAGLIRLRPEEGWKLTEQVITESKLPFTQRYSVLRLLRFCYGSQPDHYRGQVLRCCTLLLSSDVQDLTVDDLRKWQLWDLTDQVLSLWGEDKAPITKRAIVRYCLICPDAKSKKFIEKMQRQDPKLVKEVELTLQSELSKN